VARGNRHRLQQQALRMTGFPMLTLNQNLNPTKRQEILQGARKKCAKKTKIKQRRNHESRRLPVWLSIRPLGRLWRGGARRTDQKSACKEEIRSRNWSAQQTKHEGIFL